MHRPDEHADVGSRSAAAPRFERHADGVAASHVSRYERRTCRRGAPCSRAPSPPVPTLSIHASRSSASVALQEAHHLFLVMECARPLAGGVRHRIDGIDEVRFGRGERRAQSRTSEEGRRVLTITVPDSHMSAAHARLRREGSSWILEDRASKNGTFVGGVRVATGTVGDGDVVQLGHAIFRLRTGMPTAADAPLDVESSGDEPAFSTLIPAIARALDDLTRVVGSDVPILLLGETGTGKEVLARALHRLTARRGPFVAINCGALPASLVESTLFGHRKGAFSGASTEEPGLIRAAEGGTVLLDEVGDLPLSTQVALLRVLQEREVLPVGATRPVPVDVRVIACTHRDLEARVVSGEFREDLLARLAGFVHSLTPLRDRIEDLGALMSAILRRHTGAAALSLSPEACAIMMRHTWPRNVRELEKALARAAALAAGGAIDADRLALDLQVSPAPARSRDAPVQACVQAGRAGRPVPDDVRRSDLLRALTEHGGNLSVVARAFSTSRSQVHRWLKRFGLDPESFRR
jgi:DNA-binding NtrC family response regulator